jgi:hypothetical protein
MGSDAEPLTTLDLVGLLLTCIGFITYSGFGFAHNFLVAQVPCPLSLLSLTLTYPLSLSLSVSLSVSDLR